MAQPRPRTTSFPALVAVAAVSIAGLLAADTQAEARAVAFVDIEPLPPRYDARVPGEVVRLPSGPPPISGGTLLVLRDGHRAAIADPDRDRVLIVDLDLPAATAVTGRAPELLPGAEPGRIAEDAAGRVHVVLRGLGAVLTLHTSAPDASGVLRASRRAVCPMPRGIAYDAATDSLHVACRGGELVTMPAAGGAATRTLHLDRDLRDVVVVGDRLYVTRFRAAELLVVGPHGTVIERQRPADTMHSDVAFAPAVAWRALPLGDGTVAVLHQHESRHEVIASSGGYGPMRSAGCDGIVRAAFTVTSGVGLTTGPEIAGAILPVDFAVAPGSTAGALDRLAVIAAGNQSGEGSVIIIDSPALRAEGCLGATRAVATTPDGAPIANPIAVAFASGQRLVVQQRDPARLVIIPADGTPAQEIVLGGASSFDTGHAIFHASTDAGIACASCHPEGGEDGHVWRFGGIGDRRTPALHTASGTAPFHWNGDLTDVRHLMNEVFVLRMRGDMLDADHADAVEGWLAHIPRPRAGPGDAAAIAAGRALFAGEAGCASCHSGPLMTNLGSADVGSGGTFQVPSLIGSADRLPLMHTGCATTMRARFDPACGGDRHGPELTDAQQTALVAYLESL